MSEGARMATGARSTLPALEPVRASYPTNYRSGVEATPLTMFACLHSRRLTRLAKRVARPLAQSKSLRRRRVFK
jgi:hypothetical protein